MSPRCAEKRSAAGAARPLVAARCIRFARLAADVDVRACLPEVGAPSPTGSCQRPPRSGSFPRCRCRSECGPYRGPEWLGPNTADDGGSVSQLITGAMSSMNTTTDRASANCAKARKRANASTVILGCVQLMSFMMSARTDVRHDSPGPGRDGGCQRHGCPVLDSSVHYQRHESCVAVTGDKCTYRHFQTTPTSPGIRQFTTRPRLQVDYLLEGRAG
jgi:hypothetical protein